MPTVPRYEPQVQEQGFPTVRNEANAPLEAFGGGQGLQNMSQATQGLMNQTFKIAHEEKQKADQLATTEALVKTVQLKNKLMWDPQVGVMTRKGKDALAAPDEFLNQFDQHVKSVEEGLANVDQQIAYRKIVLEQRSQLNEHIQKHVFQETQRYDDEVTTAGLKTAMDEAVLNYHDPGQIQTSLQNVQGLLVGQAQRQGWSPEMLRQKVEEATSKTHSAVIARMIDNGEDIAAKKYFDSVKGEITHDIGPLEKALNEGTTRGESQRGAETAWDEAKGNMAKALQIAQEKYADDPKVLDATQARIRQKASDISSAEDFQKKQIFNQVDQILVRTKDISKVPASLWSQLSLSQQNSLKSSLEANPEPNGKDFYNLTLMAASPVTRGQFMQLNLPEYRGKMTGAELHSLMETQAKLAQGDESTQKKLQDFRSQDEIVKGTISAFGIDPTPKDGSSEAKKVMMIKNLIGERQAAEQKVKNRPLSNDELKGIANDVLLEQWKTPGIFWGTNNKSVKDIDISSDDRRNIIRELVRANKPVNEKNIIELYFLKQKKK